jgi:hydrogenase maturation protease
MSALRKVTVLVCGDAVRGDDAVGEAVMRALPATTHHLCEVRSVGALMPDDLIAAREPVIVLDAVHGPAPGTLVDLPLSALTDLAAAGVTPGSSHALPLPIVLGIVQRMAGRLPDGRFLGVAAQDFTLGAPLSPAVDRAVPGCAARLNHWVRALVHERRARACA